MIPRNKVLYIRNVECSFFERSFVLQEKLLQKPLYTARLYKQSLITRTNFYYYHLILFISNVCRCLVYLIIVGYLS